MSASEAADHANSPGNRPISGRLVPLQTNRDPQSDKLNRGNRPSDFSDVPWPSGRFAKTDSNI
jgi:hypothetical protein